MDKLMKWTTAILCVFALASVTLVLYFAMGKVIVLAEEGSGTSVEVADKHYLHLSSEHARKGSVVIPLSAGVKAEGVRIRSIDLYRGVEVTLTGGSITYYEDAPVIVEWGSVNEAYCYEEAEGGKLLLRFSQMAECSSRIVGDTLQIILQDPRELYDSIVVIDDRPSMGLYQEQADIIKNVTTNVKNQWADSRVKIYETASEEGIATDEQVLSMVNELPATLFIKLDLSLEEDTEEYGIRAVYNDLFFMPELSNARFAGFLAYETAKRAENRIREYAPCDEDSLLKQIGIPACELSLGCLSHPKEKEMLERTDYQAMLAQGITTALGDALEELK